MPSEQVCNVARCARVLSSFQSAGRIATICAGIVMIVICSPLTARAQAQASQAQGFAVEQKLDRLIVTSSKRPVIEFVFHDEKIARPYICNVHAPSGARLTRNNPPDPSSDATDHDTMHPGIWLAFGDINGQDFWRNKGHIEHVRFSERPTVGSDRVTFSTDSKLIAADGQTQLGALLSRVTVSAREYGWLVIWDATLVAESGDMNFGDQEEMGFGVRMATELTEKRGGVIRNSNNQKGSGETWGQAADWCDYSGMISATSCGITVMSAPANFRSSWWHNRDYGLIVANPFGRAAMKQGAPSIVTVKKGDSLRLNFAAALHAQNGYDPAAAYQDYVSENNSKNNSKNNSENNSENNSKSD